MLNKTVPLWSVTTWDKKFANVPREWQPQTKKYNYLFSDTLNSIKCSTGDIRILYTGKEIAYTTSEKAKNFYSSGEIVAIPWGGIPSIKYYKGKFVTGDNRIATSNDTDLLSNKYLYYYLRSKLDLIASFYKGASLKHPCMKDILSLEIKLIEINEQSKLCKLLENIENSIDKKKKELIVLDELIKSRFICQEAM